MNCTCPYCGSEYKPAEYRYIVEDRLLMWMDGYTTLKPSHAAIFETLLDATPKAVRRYALFDSLWETHQDHVNPPDEKIVEIHICTLNRQLREAGAPLRIKLRGYGLGWYIDGAIPKKVIDVAA